MDGDRHNQQYEDRGACDRRVNETVQNRPHRRDEQHGRGQIAEAITLALKNGLEEVAVGDVAKDILARYLADPKTLEREMGQ